MASKTLTAKVRLNTTQFESKIKRIARAIDALNNAVGKQSNAYNAVNSALGKTDNLTEKVSRKTKKTKVETEQWASALRTVNDKLNAGDSILGKIGNKIKALAATYLGIMGMKTAVKTSDILTSAENKINYVTAQNMGESGYNKDGTYSEDVFKYTEEALGKMYTSSQKVRMSYDDMMSNVAKSVVLCGDAFNHSTDNAIRFQEIMAEAYAVGGATAQEMSTSMYQLIQGMSGNLLAGDELRSVREGAPLAYKEIEKFAQKVYQTDETLKDMAADGKITADIVVNAIMQAGDKLDTAFAQTEQTFAQTWDQIKNTAIRAFTPVAKQIRKLLNSAIESGLIQKVEKLFVNIAKGALIALAVIKKTIGWIVDNWSWLQHVVIAGIMLMITWTLIKTGISVACAIVEMKAWMELAGVQNKLIVSLIQTAGIIAVIIMAIMMLIYVIWLWKNGTISTTEAIVYCLAIIGIAFLIVAAIMTAGVYAIVGLVILGIAAIIYWFSEVCGAVTWFGILCKNIGLEIAGFFVALAWVIANAFMTAVEFVVDIFNGSVSWICALFVNLGQTVGGIATNIGIVFSNAWNGALSTFWNFIASCIEGLDWLAQPLENIAKLFGKDFSYSSFTDSIRNKADQYASKQEEYVNWNGFEKGWSGDAWSSGVDKWSAPKWAEDSTWSEMQNSVGGFEKGWSKEAYNIGYEWGQGIENKINEWGSQWQTGIDTGSFMDDIANSLGLNPDEFLGLFDNRGLDYDDVVGNLDHITDDVGNISDSMDLTDDDLEYLRRIAEMEWRNEFTTAEIKIDMTNHNTVNSDRDLDGIVEYLSDVLRDEMTSVANGVHY